MKERIKEIIEKEDLTPTKMADKLNVSRAVISHILNGRNNPSLDVVMSILNEMPYINSDWLLSGKGEMYNDEMRDTNVNVDGSLFANGDDSSEGAAGAAEIMAANRVNSLSRESGVSGNEPNIAIKTVAKKISQIIIYYDDNTFETFTINKK